MIATKGDDQRGEEGIRTQGGQSRLGKRWLPRKGTNKTKKRVIELKKLYHQEEDELHKEKDELF
jgi:hypothetical protein